MDIKIDVNIKAPESLARAIEVLAAALSQTEPTAKPYKQKQKKSTANESKPVKESPKEEPTREEPQPEVTLEQVRAKLAALSQAGKQAQVKKLINDFGASKLTEIPAEKYPELLAAAEEIA